MHERVDALGIANVFQQVYAQILETRVGGEIAMFGDFGRQG